MEIKMSLFKCKMCAGTLEIDASKTIATCEYCGTQQTLPKLNDDRRVNLYDRANHFRRNNEFDKAMGIYEQILNEDNTDAEAYWSLVLCRYGIEYVEDPASHKRVPTVNRAQFTSVFDDDNYKSALQYADGYQRGIYEEEAKAINEIQKGILAISGKEEPFDVFICYKESDNNGRRTPDSVLAQDLYYQLKQEGFKVFFARITLEDKLGSAYEPYIFAALNSAKVMVALGTKPEFFNAVWVKNEWSRYLALIKQGQKKILIPAYKDMDPYDLPEEFSHLQAQDMSKLGFMQDLLRGIKKIMQADVSKETVRRETVVSTGNASAASLLRRAFIFLEDGDWTSANEYCEKVLDIDPENSEAYMAKLMAELNVKTQEALKDQKEPFHGYNNYQKAVRFADSKFKATLEGYIEHINTRNENERLDGIYKIAKATMNDAASEGTYKRAGDLFSSITNYLDSAELANECYEKAEIARKDDILRKARSWMTDTVQSLEKAIEIFKTIPGWRDVDEQIVACQRKIEEIKERRRQEEERREKERKRTVRRNLLISLILTLSCCVAVALVVFYCTVIVPNNKYEYATTQMDEGNIIVAYDALIALDGYKDSAERAESIYEEYKVEKLKVAAVGDHVFFGAYEQDNDSTNGAEEIEWRVLEKNENRLLLISEYALDCKPYNNILATVSWETASLREWLNNDFINTAFSEDELMRIPTVDVSEEAYDRVFLLSADESEKYFTSSDAIQCKPTEYAIANGAKVEDRTGGFCMWWQRAGYSVQMMAPYINLDGVKKGDSVNKTYICVRPALWIDLNS